MIKKDLLHRRNGFSTIELVAATAILVVLAAILPKVLTQLNKSASADSALMSAEQNARAVLQLTGRLLSNARYSTIVVTSENGEAPYSKISFLTGTNDYQELYQVGSDLWHYRKDVNTRSIIQRGGLERILFAYPDLADSTTIQVAVTTFNSDVRKKSRILGQAVSTIRLNNK